MKNWYHSDPLIIAHRGASGKAPENTLAAFELALELGADGVELDAKFTADRKVAVLHDQSLVRTTGAEGKIQNVEWDDLKTLDAGKWKGDEYAGEAIPSLEEVFSAIGGKLLINIEVTNYATSTDGLAEAIVDMVIGSGIEDTILFSSFFPSNLVKIRRKTTNIPVALLTLPGKEGWFGRTFLSKKFSPEFLHPEFTDVTLGLVKKGRRINTWTVNHEEDIQRMLKYGVAGVITDHPDVGIKLRDKLVA